MYGMILELASSHAMHLLLLEHKLLVVGAISFIRGVWYGPFSDHRE